MSAESETPKMSKGELTALRIQEAAVDLVLANGIDGTTVEQICQAANVSERTFFNHFKTKELAIIGDDLPTINESKARDFLAAPIGDIFADAMDLIPGPRVKSGFHTLVFKRLQMMRQNPGLFASHMDKLLATRDEHAHLVYLRLKRTHADSYTDDELRKMANQISEIVASIFRAQVEEEILDAKSPSEMSSRGTGEKLKKLIDLGLRA